MTKTTLRDDFIDDVLDVLAQYEAGGFRKTGTGNCPLNTLFECLAGHRRQVFYTGSGRAWRFPTDDRVLRSPLCKLQEALEDAGFEVYKDETYRRVVNRVRLAEAK